MIVKVLIMIVFFISISLSLILFIAGCISDEDIESDDEEQSEWIREWNEKKEKIRHEKGEIMRKPKVENKYNLKPKDIQKAIILDYDRLHESPFWRNDVVQAWCLSDGTGKGCRANCMDSYWIGFYDKNAKAYAGKIRLSCSSYEDMCNYNFTKFFDPNEIEYEVDLELQEKLLSRINWLIDEEIIEIPK